MQHPAPQTGAIDEALVGRTLVEHRHAFTGEATALLCLPTDTDDPIVQQYLRGDSPNEYMLRILLATTEPGDRVLDLGCHVGTFAIGAVALGREVSAVDASPFHVALVRKSVELNQFGDTLQPHWLAIDASRDTVDIIESGIFSHVVDAGSHGSIRVPASTLDRFAEDHLGDRIAFMKMDIEGAELAAIESGRSFLRAFAPVILYESNGMTLKLAGSSVDDLRESLERLSYKTFRIEGEQWIYSPVDEVQPEGWVDMVALTPAHQARWADRLVWEWPAESVYLKCLEWSRLPFPNTRMHLLAELRARRFDPVIRSRIAELAASVEEGLGGAA